jgi:hypothetical protein
MSEPERATEPDVEGLVRGHLARQAAGVNPAALLAGVKARLADAPAPARPAPPARSRRRVVVILAAAASVAAAILIGHTLAPPARASAETLVRQARAAHALSVDRCYRVELVPAAGRPLPHELLRTLARQTRLWTRGDRFEIESDNPRRPWALGRDGQGNLWLAAGRGHGIRFDKDEVPEPVALACDALGMRAETLLDEVLVHFDLHREPGAPAGAQRIRAVPRAGRPAGGLRGVILDVDEHSGALRRLELERTRGELPLATVTFVLVETRPLDDARYQLGGHLDREAPVFDRQHRPRQRLVVLWKYFGFPAFQGRPEGGRGS